MRFTRIHRLLLYQTTEPLAVQEIRLRTIVSEIRKGDNENGEHKIAGVIKNIMNVPNLREYHECSITAVQCSSTSESLIPVCSEASHRGMR